MNIVDRPLADVATTLLAPEARDRLVADPKLGCGNFLPRCLAENPARDADLFFLETPLALSDGTRLARLSLASLSTITRSLASWYLASGIGRSDIVAVCVSEGIGVYVHYLSLTSIGAVPALINPAMPRDVAAAYVQQNEFPRLVTDMADAAEEFRARLGPLCQVDCLDALPAAAADALPEWWPYEPADEDLVMLCHSSGTTGLPKAVEFGHGQFFNGKRERLQSFVEGDGEQMLSAMPHSHSAGISYLMNATILGIPSMIQTALFGERVRRQVKRFRPTIVAGFPQTIASLAGLTLLPREFPSVRRWFTMGDAAHESHIRAILEASPEARVIDAFGSSELGMALFYRVSTIDDVAHRRSIGRAIGFADVKILDTETYKEVPSGTVGLLAVSSPTLTPGYWRRPDLTSAARRDGYWLTGDVAFEREGEFFQLDRTVDVINSKIGPLYTLLLEEVVQAVDGVADASVFGCIMPEEEDETVAVVIDPYRSGDSIAEIDPQAVISAIQEAAQDAAKGRNGGVLSKREIHITVAADEETIPRGSTGKVLKRLLRDRFPTAYGSALVSGQSSDGLRVVH